MASQLKLAALLVLSLLASVGVAAPLPVDSPNVNANGLPAGGASASGPQVYHNNIGFPPAPIPHTPSGLHTRMKDHTARVDIPLGVSVGQHSHPNTRRKGDKNWDLRSHLTNVDAIPINFGKYKDMRDVQDDTALHKYLNDDVDGARGEDRRDRSGPS